MRNTLLNIIKIYQKIISPLLGRNCRFYPSCSQYTVDSLKKHGVFKGLTFSFLRTLKCNPFYKGGVNPVK